MLHRQYPLISCGKKRFGVSTALRSLAGLAGGLALSLGYGLSSAGAASPDTAPAELTAALEQIEAAASAQNVAATMSSYSSTFTNEDGFTYETLEAALETLWGQYDTLNYRVELQSWEPSTNGFVAETVTYIDGTQMMNGQPTQLESIIRSEQNV